MAAAAELGRELRDVEVVHRVDRDVHLCTGEPVDYTAGCSVPGAAGQLVTDAGAMGAGVHRFDADSSQRDGVRVVKSLLDLEPLRPQDRRSLATSCSSGVAASRSHTSKLRG